MKLVSIYEAKAHLSKLIASLETGEDRIVLCRHGVPVADLVPHRREDKVLDPDPVLAGARFVEPSPSGVIASSKAEEEWPAHLL